MLAVERVECPDVPSFRSRYFKPNKPVILLGTQRDWPARSWTAEGLKQRLGDLQVSPVVLNEGHVHVDLERGLVDEPMTFRAYIDQLGEPPPPRYSLTVGLDGPLADLRQDLSVPPYCLGSIFMKVNLWVAPQRTITDAHYDMLHNLLAQVRGRRLVTLFAPEDTPFLYPYPLRTLHWHHSQVQVEAPDLVRFPNFRRARALRVELMPGDLLFIPRGWWHQVEALEPSIAVNFFWLTPRLIPEIALAKAAWTLQQIRSS